MDWPLHATIVPPSRGQSLHLTDQHHVIRLLLHDAIQFETASLINKNAQPEFQQRDSYRQQALLAAAVHKIEVSGMKDIQSRLVADPDFGQQLGNTVCTSVIPLLQKKLQ